MAISAVLSTELTPTDSAPAIAGITSTKLVFDANRTQASLNSASTPAVTKKANFTLTLSGGVASIDLTAVPDAAGPQDFTGLKIQSMKFQNTGANKMTLTKGASNGLGLTTGNDSWTVPLPPVLANAAMYPEIVLALPEGTPDIDSTHKTIDVAGSGSQQLLCTIVAG